MDGQPEVITIGETMLMFAPPPFHRIEYANIFMAMIGGAEANVAIGLKRLGIDSGWISKLVDNPLGRKILNTIRGYGVDVSRVVLTQKGRIGTFFVEFGAEPRPLRTIYDRKGSAITTLKPEEIDWEYVSRAKLLHQTGITPALSSCCRNLTLKAAEKAKEMGLKNSFDINYRSLLWKPDEARRTLDTILPNVDILISTLDDANLMLEDNLPPEAAATEMRKEYGCEVVVITLGTEGSIAVSDKTYRGRPYHSTEINRLGAGDAFAAGFLYGYLRKDIQAGLEIGGAMAALKFTVPLDVPVIDKEDIHNLLKGLKEDVVR